MTLGLIQSAGRAAPAAGAARRVLVRWASKKAAAEPAKAGQRELALQREREQKRLQLKREGQRAVRRLQVEARTSLALPHAMDVVTALRYVRAAEVGRPAHASAVILQLRIVADRSVRKVTGTVRLPRPVDEERIAVLTGRAELAEEARRAGATLVGSDNIINAIKEGGPIEFDRLFATPDMVSRVNTIARILGPKGLMPNAKRGTVTNEIFEAVTAARGEATLRQEDTMMQIPVGRPSFTDREIVHNILAVTERIRELLQAEAAAKKGYIGRALLTSTFGPSMVIEV